MKKYLVSLKTTRGAVCNVAFYADTPDKNYRIYYCGSDTGERFERLGNAARQLARLASEWNKHGILAKKQYAARADVPRRGSNA